MRYLLIVEDKKSRRMISLDGAKYTIGRQTGNSIILNSRQASRRHATLVRKSNIKTQGFSYWIVDGDLEGKRSHNGIFINGEKCLIHELKDGDLINFGCEINASYHIMSNVTETGEVVDELPSLPSPVEPIDTAKKTLDIHNQSTLILSDSNIDHPVTISATRSSLEDDTWHDQAYLDSLTGLPNKTLFNEYLSIAIANSKRHRKPIAILLINLDQFNQINETYGYVIGDQILQRVGEVLNSCVRASDIVARWSGDSFAILLTQLTDADDSQHIQERIVKQVSEPLEISKFSVVLSIHTSLAVYSQDGEDIQSLVHGLEKRLKQAKLKSTSPPSVSEKVQEVNKSTLVQEDELNFAALADQRLNKVEHRLQVALERNEFSLVYQPQINLKTGSIEVMEALLRWKHPQRGLVSPRKFFPWLEQTDLILPITEWIVETACSQTQNWQDEEIPSVQVSVNLSARQLYHPHFLQTVTQVMAKTGLDPHWLEFEITEKAILQNLEHSRQVLKELQQLGVYLSLDDFGEGVVSIGHLQELPFHKIKIERACVHKLTDNPEDTAMIATLIAMGKSFKLQVVAEGVETQQQVEILHNLGCEVMQGYRFSHPLDIEQATEFLRLHSLKEEPTDSSLIITE